MKKNSTGKQDRKLSVHVKLPEDAHPTSANEITVVNPDTEEELLMGKLDYLYSHCSQFGSTLKGRKLLPWGKFFTSRIDPNGVSGFLCPRHKMAEEHIEFTLSVCVCV